MGWMGGLLPCAVKLVATLTFNAVAPLVKILTLVPLMHYAQY